MAEEYLTDDEQWEAVKRWLAENGPWLLGGALLGATLLFGWRYYGAYRNSRALQASAQFGQMAAALDRNDTKDARRIADEVTGKYSGSPYADQTALTLARIDVDEGRVADAVAPLTQVMNSSKDVELRKIARLRLARVLIDQGKPDAAISTLAGDEAGAFAALFDEVRGDALYAKKDTAGALAQYQKALAAGGPQGGNTALLTLKITDLGAAPEVPAAVTEPKAAR